MLIFSFFVFFIYLFIFFNCCSRPQKYRLENSYRGNARIVLALQGKSASLEQQGVYDALEKSGNNRRADGGGCRKSELDAAGFARLPRLDRKTAKKLQDDLLDGLHVTYHDLCESAVFCLLSLVFFFASVVVVVVVVLVAVLGGVAVGWRSVGCWLQACCLWLVVALEVSVFEVYHLSHRSSLNTMCIV